LDTSALSEPSSVRPSDEAKPDALGHAWNWFKYHAEQRMIVVRFYLLAVAALATGYFAVLKAEEHALAVLVAVFGAAMSVLFGKLDGRTRQLIDAGKAALAAEQAALARSSGNDAIRIIERADFSTDGWCGTYTKILSWLFRLAAVSFVLAAVIAACR
jgi:hypothetical protein